MRRILTTLTIISCSGDGLVLGRLDVTPTLREACAGVAGGDPFIEAAISLAEDARLGGGSFSGALATVQSGCTFEDCITCGIAIVNQVYGI